MSHLLADLMGYRNPFWAALVPMVSVPGVALLLLLLQRAARGGWRNGAVLVSVACVLSVGINWATFLAALKSSFPHVGISIPTGHAIAATAAGGTCSFLAIRIAVAARRSSRNVLLSGSLLSFGFSCMIFISMAGMVSPFSLSYDLSAVLAVMVLGAALSSFAIWEGGGRKGRHTDGIAVLLGAGAFTTVAFGSPAAVLSFGDWMTAVAQPDDLTSSPIVVIGAAEGVVVLFLCLVGSLIDNRVAARDELEADRLRQLADSTFEAILIHRGGVVLDGNVASTTLLGVQATELPGRELRSILAGTGQIVEAATSSETVESEITARGGRRVPVEMLSRPIRYRGDAAIVTALRDISERRASEARIRFMALHDMLTELPNRVLLKERLDAGIAQATSTSGMLAVLALDLDGFKLVNDTYGHAVGDDLLKQVGRRIRNCLRTDEFVARIGGDEFVVIQPGGNQPSGGSDLAQRIIASLSEPFDLDGRRATIGTSIGVAIYPANADAPDLLLKRADIALYRAKHAGRGCFRFFDAEIDHEVDDRPQLEQELRKALANGELSLAYQPISDATGHPISFEALMRWTHPVLGPISPARFIPIAEERKLIVHMGEWALREACRNAAAWAIPCRVAVNLSPVQVLEKGLVALVGAILSETGLEADRLELEITEGVLLQDEDAACAVIQDLGALGVRVVLDDFGTGYSSLSYLHRFPFRKLKIDRSFVQRLSDDQSARAIVKAIISMSRDLGIAVTAEGVETQDHLERLRLLQCHEFQGFLFNKPMSAEEANDTLLRRAADEGLLNLQALRDDLRGAHNEPKIRFAV
ncbi:putative bifunctional diguanylate cyclase/phosphodiesterase [Aureimonas jatrophae]|uniref:PAS domain S-box-containing protein/diguanylate cyclase (GGDEF) domain-containing protein n=1 Tax=Aureimonas jatrophae TaxID=1166073 RepID=A0A1H0MY41_9HYPH|nr:EAL domain-containing protein [Aureimonas jatrophae]MBB3953003.1 diguanylate cyclase (GGDEF)-like protein/PAS domain S-box-containing protein [Aureimonas jatrophae]SDO85388.1 PAS domain S-box-containing protein/diguanylate cyclase (GGDEF) domain-containing protein [Aureimonas jatrophae]